MKLSLQGSFRLFGLALGVLALGGVNPALAVNYTWTGSAGPATWNQAANWGGVTPAFNNQADVFFNAASAGNLSNLLNNTDKTVRSLNFTANATSNVSISLSDNIGGTGTPRNLIFDANTGNARISVDSAANAVYTIGVGTAGAVVLNDNLDVEINNASAVVQILRQVTGTNSITQTGVGTLRLTSSNSYSGATTVAGGTLQVSSLSNGGGNSTLGASSSAAANLVLNGGTLQVVTATTAQSTDRQFTLGTNGGALSSNGGTGSSMAFTNTGAIALQGAGLRTLTLDGSQNGSLQAVLGDNGGASSLVKNGAGQWTLGGASTYSGDTTVNAGTLILADGGALAFTIGADDVNNQIVGNAGTLSLDGDFVFDLTGAAIADGNSWVIVNNLGLGGLSYGGNFSVISTTLGLFTEAGNVWTRVDGSNTWQYSESTGILTLDVVPEPSTWALLTAGLTACVLLRRRRSGTR